MTKNNNKGFSLVEVIVAVAIFAILVIPLTTQLISAININKRSTKKQYAIEKAEAIMEALKTADLDTSSGTILVPDDSNDSKIYTFALDSKVTHNLKTDLGDTYPDVDYTVYTYECSDIAYGTNYQKYSAVVYINDAAYEASAAGYIWATTETTDDGAVAAGSVTGSSVASVGTVRNLDNAQVAIIASASYMGTGSGTTMNTLDNYAYEYFLETEVGLLAQYPVYLGNYNSGQDYFVDDTIDKYTDISITNDGGSYTITCTVKYVCTTGLNIIRSEFESNGKNIYESTVYQQTYEELVPVYFVYLPLMYDGIYRTTNSSGTRMYDYIRIDTSGLKDTEEAKVYIFEAAANADSISETYAEIICSTLGLSDISDITYTNQEGYNSTQFDVGARVCLNDNSTTTGTVNTSIYTNLDVDSSSCMMKAYFLETGYTDEFVLQNIKDDTSEEAYLYDIIVKIYETESDGTKGSSTTITGTRGR